jgi:hypothetical protein
LVFTVHRRDNLARTSGYKRRRYDGVKPIRPLESQKTSMLSLHRTTSFRYDLREIMSHYEVNEGIAASVVATVLAKGSRVSIESAKAYVRDQQKTGAYPSEVSDEICDLLDRWSRYR